MQGSRSCGVGTEAPCTGTWALVPAGWGVGSRSPRGPLVGWILPLGAGHSPRGRPPCRPTLVGSGADAEADRHTRRLGACLALGWGLPPARPPCLAASPRPHFPAPLAGPSPFPPRVPFSRRLPSPPPRSCWEWRLHFSCHLHSQSIRTPQLSRLAELGGRRRRERVLWGPSPPHRSHSAPDCFLLRRAQPAGRGGSGNPWSSCSLRGTRDGRRDGARARPGARPVGARGGAWAAGPAASCARFPRRAGAAPTPGCRLTSSLRRRLPARPRGRSWGSEGPPSW